MIRISGKVEVHVLVLLATYKMLNETWDEPCSVERFSH